MVHNLIGGAGGGLKPTIIVTAPTGSTVTCDSRAGTEISGMWTFVVSLGNHTVVCTNAKGIKTQTVVVDEIAVYNVNIVFERLLTKDDFNAGTFINGTHEILTNQVDGTDGLKFIGRANNPSYWKISSFIRLDLTVDFTDLSFVRFKAKKVVRHGSVVVCVTDGLYNTSTSWQNLWGDTTPPRDESTTAYAGIWEAYNKLPDNEWVDKELDVSDVDGEHILSICGGCTDSSGNASSETHYCDIVLG